MHVCTLGEAQMLCCDAESCSGLGPHGITQWGLLTCPRSHSWIMKLWYVKALEKEYAGSSLCFSFGWLMVASCCICIISVTSLCSFGISLCLLLFQWVRSPLTCFNTQTQPPWVYSVFQQCLHHCNIDRIYCGSTVGNYTELWNCHTINPLL